MQNEILTRYIIKELRKGPLSESQLAMALSVDKSEIDDAIPHLIQAGKIATSMDGYRYELAGGGYCPDGWPGGAA